MNRIETIEWLRDYHGEEPEVLGEAILQGEQRDNLKWSNREFSFKKGQRIRVRQLVGKDPQSCDFWLVDDGYQLTGIPRNVFSPVT